MEVEAVRYLRRDKHAFIELRLDGRLVQIGREMRPGLVDMGIIVVGEFDMDGQELANLLPPIKLPRTRDRAELVLRGATRDKEVWRLWREFARRVDKGLFQPGGVPA